LLAAVVGTRRERRRGPGGARLRRGDGAGAGEQGASTNHEHESQKLLHGTIPFFRPTAMDREGARRSQPSAPRALVFSSRRRRSHARRRRAVTILLKDAGTQKKRGREPDLLAVLRLRALH